uniref:DUF4371 domain-containing protein n=1 Tax=Pelodiscus sinensis TaxID=13735 RepID=K7GIF2_PELSI
RNVKRKYSEDYIKFSFTCQEKEGVDLLQCVICFKVLGNDSMKPAKLKLHLKKCHPNVLQKDEDYFERQLSGLKWQRLDSTSAFYNKTSNAVRASYIIAYKVAQAKKPHTIVQQLVLPCAREMVWLVLGKEAARKLNDISLSNDTVSRRINEISQNISEQVVDEIKKSPLFAIQLDKSTDIALCQLLLFARYVVEGDFKDQFLFCNLDTTTKAEDVMEIVHFFEAHGLGLSKSCECHHGFQTLVKQHGPMVTGVHCFIHRKTLLDQLNVVSKGLVKVANHIKSSALDTRLFKRFCLDMGSDFDWLSAGNTLNRVFQLREELDLFLQAQKLAYLVNIFGILNKLNLQLQGKGANLFSQQSIIRAFLDKLELWIVRVKGNNLVQFPYVDAMLGGKGSHLDANSRSFTEPTRLIPLILSRNPFTTDVNSVPEDLQEEFLDLKNDFAAQDEYQQSTIEKFWASVTGSYPNLSAHAVRFLLPFASTYRCESGVSCLLHV